MYANKNEFPDWLLGIGLRVEDWSFRYPQAAQHIRKQMSKYHYEHRQRDQPTKMEKCPDGVWRPYSKPNPVLIIPEKDGRRLTITEEFFACAVIHDVTCPYAKPMKTWRSRKYRGKSQKLWVHASNGISIAYYIAKKYVSDLKDEDCYKVFHGFRNVEADLRRLNLIPHESSTTTIVFSDMRHIPIPTPAPQPGHDIEAQRDMFIEILRAIGGMNNLLEFISTDILVKCSENRPKSEPTPMNERLKKIAIRTDELLQGGDHVLERFRRMILDCDVAVKQDGSPERRGLVGRLPIRALSLPESYSWLAAIRDTFCEDVKPINPYDTMLERLTQTDGARMNKGLCYAIRMIQVKRLTNEDFLERMEKALTAVEDDLGVKPQQTLPPVTDESNQPSPTSAKTQAPATIVEPLIENLAPPLRAENDDGHHQNNSIEKVTTSTKNKRKISKKVEMMGKASVVVQAIYGQTEEDTGKTLSDILLNAEVSRETFNKSVHFNDARMVWNTLKSKRDDNQHYLKDNSDSKSDY